ncbi:MAG: hypothetical protein JF886_14480 [Candidatus Dormibacteraeota bacterium]|uniref:Uncharacterized protein n=1 Tax=Candidatus Aeolococcus gillhamiae TaxID=3127015 RepID=A0A934JXR3_9BACT|nr:hypothetical protein [Candidatus Dormibacteraeota bacterium]
MALHDLAQALPGLVVAVLLPGYALATLLVPRWRAWERLAGAPGLAAGFLGVLGLGMRLVHIPFEPLTVLPCIAALAAAATFRARRTEQGPRTERPWWIAVPALIAGGVAAGVFAAALSGQVLPPDWDPRAHGALAAAIARTHDVIPVFPIPLQGTAFSYARPGFEAMTAVVSWIGGPSPAACMTPVITVCLVLMPLGLTLLALEAGGSLALAAVVPLVAVGMAFPSFQAILGRFPQVVDSTLVVPFIVAAMRLVRGREALDNALLLGVATASIWVVHGLEVLTALVVGGLLLAMTAVRALRASAGLALLRTGAAGVAVAAGAAVVTLLTRRPHVSLATVAEASTIPSPSAGSPAHLHMLLQLVAQTDFVSPLAVGLYVVGIGALLVRRRMWWVLVAHIVVILAMADSLYWHHLGRFWRDVVFPYGDEDRLLGVQFWIIPFIVGTGLLAVATVMRRLAADRRLAVASSLGAVMLAGIVYVLRTPLDRAYTDFFANPVVNVPPLGVFDRLAHPTHWRIAAICTLLALVAGWIGLCLRTNVASGLRARFGVRRTVDAAAAAVAVIALIGLALGGQSELGVYQRAVVDRATATPADVAVLARMSAALPKGSLVLTDGLNDAGIWVLSLTDLTPLVPPGSEGGALSLPLLAALSHACDDPAAAVAALQNVAAIFVGSHTIPGSAYPWRADCIAQLPGVRKVASAPWQGTEAAGFAVSR